MDKAILKKFAIESRQDLMDKVRGKIKLFYIDEEFNSEQKGDIYVLSNEKHSLSLTNDEYKKRELLIKRIKELSLEQVIEEAAYTWFNRIIAIRYMEINDMIPLTKDNQSLGIRVLSSKDNTPDPEILKFTNLMNPELDIDFKKEKYVDLKDDNEKFKYILLLICRKLGKVIPQVFDGITDYIDILIPDNLLNDTGFITKVIREVPEENYRQVEIIGWLYQYYNQSEKDRVMAENRAYKSNEIAYVTQLFTPDWIVKYMVENSLGKFWIENLDGQNDISSSSIKNEWKFYINEQDKKEREKITPKDISFIDPCCGSGHILVYAFEIFYQIYLNAGYNKNEISEMILKNNLYGLDIDDRAGQLSVLSVLLKAREYDKNIFNNDVIKEIKIMSIPESNNIEQSLLDYFIDEEEKDNVKYLIDNLYNAKTIGSLLKLENRDYTNLEVKLMEDDSIFGIELRNKIFPLIKVATILSKKYQIIVTNPPYLAYSSMDTNLKKYLDKYYVDSKKDLCTAFMEIDLLENNGYYGIINQHSWMFISSYEKLRKKIIDDYQIISMIHLGTRAFEEIGGEVVQTTSFIFNKAKNSSLSKFIRLVNCNDSTSKMNETINMIRGKKYYSVDCNIFKNIPGYTFDYWINNNVLELFKNKKIRDYAKVITGMTTGNNNKFLKLWYEVDLKKIEFNNKTEEDILTNKKYFYPYSKGGMRVKWYGGYDYVVNWSLSGQFNRAKTTLKELYFKKAITWPFISSGNFTAKILNNGFLWDVAGSPCFVNDNKYFNYILSYLNTPIANELLNMINPTINVQAVDIEILPLIIDNNKLSFVDDLVNRNIEISKEDWNSFETSWDFTRHPLLKPMSKVSTIRDSLSNWNNYSSQQRSLLKHNEVEINKIFIDIYGLNDEFSPTVNDKDITIRKEDKVRDIKSFISYAVGCMFGRYSLDEEGLVYAGGDFNIDRYKTFKVDNDNIIPITDEAYFSDDIVERFKTFTKIVYGDNTFNENMDFIAETLGKKGTETSEETIRRYFVNDFFNDHVKMYQKRPIYWLLDSGKKNGFKALVYMHRYNENLIPKARLDYLHRVQTTYEKLLSDVNYKLTTDLSMTEKKEAKNRQADLNAKLNEIKEYDEKIAHIANQRISIDLDDGVKVNYEKFKDILAKIK